MRISIFGTGYVGLVTGACLADLGNNVLCCDIDQNKINSLQNAQLPFYEPGLAEVVSRNIKEGRLLFTLEQKTAVEQADLIFIAVGTPSLPDGGADLSHVRAVAKTIGENLSRSGVIVATKSTVPVGTTAALKGAIANYVKARGEKFEFAVINNPEFLRQGKAVEDFNIPDRIVVGVEDEWAKKIMETLYAPYSKNGNPIYFMDLASSELTKYVANTFIAARISLINEVAQICEKTGADVEKVRMAAGADPRIGTRYLYPGVGYGGSCFPKDVKALAHLARQLGLKADLISQIEAVNENQKLEFAEKIINGLGGKPGKKLAIWGLSFKPHTDDMREAPAAAVIKALLGQGISISAYDPAAAEVAKKLFGDKISLAENMYNCLNGCDGLAVLTEWPQFKEPDFNKIKQLLISPLVFDGRNIYDPLRMKQMGFSYFCVGRQSL